MGPFGFSSPLSTAAKNGRVLSLRRLLAAGADTSGRLGAYPLYLAAVRGHLACVRILVEEAGVDPDGELVQGGEAATRVRGRLRGTGRADIVRYLNDPKILEGVPIDTAEPSVRLVAPWRDEHSTHAPPEERPALLDRAIEIARSKRVRPADLADRGSRSLGIAAQNGYADLVRALLGLGCTPDGRHLGRPALMFACQRASREIIDLLLAASADPNAACDRGETALMEATKAGDPEIVEFLLERGADPSAKSEYGVTPLRNIAGPYRTRIRRALIDAIVKQPGYKSKPTLRGRGGKGRTVPSLRGSAELQKMALKGKPNWTILAVEAPLATVSEVLGSRKGARWERDIAKRSVEGVMDEGPWFLFQLTGHRWTIIVATIGAFDPGAAAAAADLSVALSKAVVVHSSSDVTGTIELGVFRGGRQTESMVADWGEDAKLEARLDALGIYIPACFGDDDGLHVTLTIRDIPLAAVDRVDVVFARRVQKLAHEFSMPRTDR